VSFYTNFLTFISCTMVSSFFVLIKALKFLFLLFYSHLVVQKYLGESIFLCIPPQKGFRCCSSRYVFIRILPIFLPKGLCFGALESNLLCGRVWQCCVHVKVVEVEFVGFQVTSRHLWMFLDCIKALCMIHKLWLWLWKHLIKSSLCLHYLADLESLRWLGSWFDDYVSVV